MLCFFRLPFSSAVRIALANSLFEMSLKLKISFADLSHSPKQTHSLWECSSKISTRVLFILWILAFPFCISHAVLIISLRLFPVFFDTKIAKSCLASSISDWANAQNCKSDLMLFLIIASYIFWLRMHKWDVYGYFVQDVDKNWFEFVWIIRNQRIKQILGTQI